MRARNGNAGNAGGAGGGRGRRSGGGGLGIPGTGAPGEPPVEGGDVTAQSAPQQAAARTPEQDAARRAAQNSPEAKAYRAFVGCAYVTLLEEDDAKAKGIDVARGRGGLLYVPGIGLAFVQLRQLPVGGGSLKSASPAPSPTVIPAGAATPAASATPFASPIPSPGTATPMPVATALAPAATASPLERADGERSCDLGTCRRDAGRLVRSEPLFAQNRGERFERAKHVRGREIAHRANAQNLALEFGLTATDDDAEPFRAVRCELSMPRGRPAASWRRR